MNKTLHKIKDKLLSCTDIFGTNGFVYESDRDFINAGVNDRFFSLFYLRYINYSTNKVTVKQTGSDMDQLSSNIRIVFQLPNTTKKDIALNAFLGQLSSMNEVTIRFFSDDTDGIYKAEYQKECPLRDYYLLSFDVTVSFFTKLSSLYCSNICIEC